MTVAVRPRGHLPFPDCRRYLRFCNHAPCLRWAARLAVSRPHSTVSVAWTLQILCAVKRLERELRQKEGGAMGFLVEVDLDEFLELMECETEARLRVAEIMERRRRAKKLASELELVESNKAH